MNYEELAAQVTFTSLPNFSETLAHFSPKKGPKINGESSYHFYETLSDTLDVTRETVAISKQPSNQPIPYHDHNYIEIMTVLSGQCTVILEKKEVHLNTGDLLFIGAGTFHKVTTVRGENHVFNLALKSNYFTINRLNYLVSQLEIPNFLTELLTHSASAQETNYMLFQKEATTQLTDIVMQIIYEYYRNDVEATKIIHAYIEILLAKLIRYQHHCLEQSQTTANQSLANYLLYIENNYAEITLEQMAQHVGFHPNYLSNQLKEKTGKTFIQLVHLQRLNVAAFYLINTRVPIEEICHRVGYSSLTYFYKIFKSFFQETPSQFRKRQQKATTAKITERTAPDPSDACD